MRGVALLAAMVCLLGFAGGCGGDDESAEKSATADEPKAAGETASFNPASLARSIEGEAQTFLKRGDTLVKQSLDRQLLGDTVMTVKPGTAECRTGAQTGSVADAKRFPYACIVAASANAGGIATEVTLGFVVTEVEGNCWTAQNERVAADGLAPVLYPKEQALSAANRLEGCVA